jgi:hypothetical protein
MNPTYRSVILLAAAAGLALAQGPHGNGGGGIGLNLAMTKLQTLTGPVTAVNIGWAMQYPSITVNKLQIKVAPVWYLLEENFEIKTGDDVSVVAAPSAVASDPYLYAVEITKQGTGAHIVLRDANGLPLWSQGGNRAGTGYGTGPMANGECISVQSIATESGVVEQITAGPGIQMPTLTLKTPDGKLLAVRLGPERILLEADLELKAGDAITVRYAVTSHDGELVALAISRGGVTVTLRGDDCRPLWS